MSVSTLSRKMLTKVLTTLVINDYRGFSLFVRETWPSVAGRQRCDSWPDERPGSSVPFPTSSA